MISQGALLLAESLTCCGSGSDGEAEGGGFSVEVNHSH